MNLNRQQRHAIALLRQDFRRDLYEAADGPPKNNKGSGLYYVTYSNGQGPELTRSDIDGMLAERLIKPKYNDASLHCYVLTSLQSASEAGK
jgi:hypothetical protein